jgi:hypothetical protein
LINIIRKEGEKKWQRKRKLQRRRLLKRRKNDSLNLSAVLPAKKAGSLKIRFEIGTGKEKLALVFR